MPFARIVVFALALFHAIGVAELMLDDGCEEACSDDECGTDCLPGLVCRCHNPSAMPLGDGTVQAVAQGATPREVAPWSAEKRMHASPDPREILHVPKRAV